MTLKKWIQPFKDLAHRYEWWQLTFFTIGILALLTIVGGLFFAVGDGPKTIYPSGPLPAVDSADFMLAVSRAVNAPSEQGGEISIQNNGDEFLTSLLKDIDQAQHTINFAVYIWSDGTMSDQVLDALIKKQRQGVQVRLLLDGLGGKSAPGDTLKTLQQAGGKVEQFRTPKFGQLTRFHKRNHRRAIVIDGHVGYTGGMAIKDVWLGNAQDPKHWRDMMFRVTGTMAESLQAGFTDHWTSTTGELLLGTDFYPPPISTTTESGPKFIHLTSSPANDSPTLETFLLMPMMAAQKKLYITTPYLIADDHLLTVLTDRAKAGVDVRILLPNKNIDNKTARWGSQNYYQPLLEAGVKIYEYQPTFIHSKFFFVDDQWSVMGSPNMNTRSRKLDEENAFGILDKNFAGQLNDTFAKDLDSAQEIKLDTWKKRSPFLRAVQLISRLLAEQS